MPRFRAHLVLAIALVLPATPVSAQGGGQPWAYRVGEARPAQQGNFCERREDALEIAGIFARFGARTGFSALSSAPGCSTRVYAVTPRALLKEVDIKLEHGGAYTVNFIQVEVAGGGEVFLITTRRLLAR